jgi:hypothetical protein
MPVAELPLDLTVRVTPVEGPVGVRTTLVAILGNPAKEPQVVNRRMLLNYTGHPGEVWVDVRGPEGYCNRKEFAVRAGKASPEFFVEFHPGASVEHSWTLDNYESLDVSGEYIVTVTYHNEDPRAPDGRPMAVGQLSASASFHRSASVARSSGRS